MPNIDATNALLEDIVPFTVAVPQADIDDLKERLRRTRWPNRETVQDWSQGVPLDMARALIKHWQLDYDWRIFEGALNSLPQFKTKIDGLEIHFIHVRSKHDNALPLLLTHGWPGSMIEFMKSIRPLTDPTAFGGNAEDAFHIVIPSLPGFGFSEKPAETGWDVSRVASAWTILMARLGYSRWLAQGGDWGAVVTTVLGLQKPAGLLGIHLNWQFVFPQQIPETLSAEERYAVETLNLFAGDLSGYNRLQSTRPQTIGYALADSPVGQAMWIYEKFQAWTDNQGLAEEALSINEMLNAISLYWFTDTGASSARMYWENRNASFCGPKLDLPVAVTLFPRERPKAPKSWIRDTYTNLIYLSEVDKGGHFAAFEQPEIFTTEVRAAFRALR